MAKNNYITSDCMKLIKKQYPYIPCDLMKLANLSRGSVVVVKDSIADRRFVHDILPFCNDPVKQQSVESFGTKGVTAYILSRRDFKEQYGKMINLMNAKE